MTRLLEFGRYARVDRAARGEANPESFAFLGFTHNCSVRRDGEFALRRQSMAKRLRAFLLQVKVDLRKRHAWSIAQQGSWLGSVARGYFQYHGIPGNWHALHTVRREVSRLWLKSLRRRSQRQRLPWSRFAACVRRWIPSCKLVHPYPNQRFAF